MCSLVRVSCQQLGTGVEVVIGSEVPEQRKRGGVTRLQIGVCYEKVKLNLGKKRAIVGV